MDNMESTVLVRNRVNGSLLLQNVGKPVSMIGNVLKMNPNNTSFDIQSSDNHVVTVNCQDMINSPIDGLVEVRGTAQGKNVISCDYYICFPPEIANAFDAEKDNEAVIIANTISNPWRS